MNYLKIYEKLISRAKSRKLEDYVERHHIIPRCMNGGDEDENIATLTPEEHFLAHLLLIKIYPEIDGLIIAINKMCQGFEGRPSRKLYGWLRRRFSEVMSKMQTGEGNSNFGKMWITNGVSCKSILKVEEIPNGWKKGRITKPRRKKPSAKCEICGTPLPRRDYIRCKTHPKDRKRCQTDSVNKKRFATNDQIRESLILHDLDIKAALAHLGYKADQSGYTVNRFIKIKSEIKF